jgi:putrescine aminotransferase
VTPDSPETRSGFERQARYLDPTFPRLLDVLGSGRIFVRAAGSTMWDSEGRSYVDFLAGCGSVPLGYNHPELVAAAEASLRASRPSFVQLGPQRGAGLLGEMLAARLGPELSCAHFANSGSEAVDGALKLAFAATRRKAVLHCDRSYHGVTLGVLPVNGARRLRAPFPTLVESRSVPFGDVDAARRRLRTERFAAFIVEPIQFEGGVRLADPSYFVEVGALCRRHGTALIFDEAQTGMGRTGTLFAHQWLGVVPDVLCYAKGFSGGLVPIAGYSTSPAWQRRAYGRIKDFELRANTFGGSALACAVACRTLELIDDARLRHVGAMGAHLGARLTALAGAHAMLRAARGKGLMWAVECETPTRGVASLVTLGIPNLVARHLYAVWIALRMMERGFLTQIPTNDQRVLRIEPPLIIERAEIDAFTDALGDCFAENERFVPFLRAAVGRMLARRLAHYRP